MDTIDKIQNLDLMDYTNTLKTAYDKEKIDLSAADYVFVAESSEQQLLNIIINILTNYKPLYTLSENISQNIINVAQKIVQHIIEQINGSKETYDFEKLITQIDLYLKTLADEQNYNLQLSTRNILDDISTTSIVIQKHISAVFQEIINKSNTEVKHETAKLQNNIADKVNLSFDAFSINIVAKFNEILEKQTEFGDSIILATRKFIRKANILTKDEQKKEEAEKRQKWIADFKRNNPESAIAQTDEELGKKYDEELNKQKQTTAYSDETQYSKQNAALNSPDIEPESLVDVANDAQINILDHQSPDKEQTEKNEENNVASLPKDILHNLKSADISKKQLKRFSKIEIYSQLTHRNSIIHKLTKERDRIQASLTAEEQRSLSLITNINSSIITMLSIATPLYINVKTYLSIDKLKNITMRGNISNYAMSALKSVPQVIKSDDTAAKTGFLKTGFYKFGVWLLIAASVFAVMYKISDTWQKASGRTAIILQMIHAASSAAKFRLLTNLSKNKTLVTTLSRPGIRGWLTRRIADKTGKVIVERAAGKATTTAAAKLSARGMPIIGALISAALLYSENPDWSKEELLKIGKRPTSGDLRLARLANIISGGERGLVNAIFHGITIGWTAFNVTLVAPPVPIIAGLIGFFVGMGLNLIGRERFLKGFILIKRFIQRVMKSFKPKGAQSVDIPDKVTNLFVNKILKKISGKLGTLRKQLTDILSYTEKYIDHRQIIILAMFVFKNEFTRIITPLTSSMLLATQSKNGVGQYMGGLVHKFYDDYKTAFLKPLNELSDTSAISKTWKIHDTTFSQIEERINRAKTSLDNFLKDVQRQNIDPYITKLQKQTTTISKLNKFISNLPEPSTSNAVTRLFPVPIAASETLNPAAQFAQEIAIAS